MNIAVILLLVVVAPAGLIVLAFGLRGQQRLRELAIRERIALIEKGLVPSPEADPARFESFVNVRRPMNKVAARFQSAGILIMGVGLGLALVISLAGQNVGVGLGIGGGLAVLGLAAFINGALAGGNDPFGSGPS